MPAPHACPFCDAEYDQPFVVCVKCGMNMKTRRVEAPQVIVEEEPEPPPTRWQLARAWLAAYFPGLFRPVVTVASLLLAVVGLAIVLFGVSMIFMGAFVGAIAMASLGGIAYAQALAWILTGEFRTLVDALVDFDSVHWTIWFTLLLLPGTVLIIAAAQAG